MARLIAHKALDKMLDYKTGKWQLYGVGLYRSTLNEALERLQKAKIEYKHYCVSTSIAGIYDDVIIVKKEEAK